MRSIAVAIVATIGLIHGGTQAKAYGTNHAFCVQGANYEGLSNCTFDTYEQCRALAAGRNLDCVANPYFAGRTDDPYAYQNRNRPSRPTYYPPR